MIPHDNKYGAYKAMNDRFNMYRDLEIHVGLQNKIIAERRCMPQTPPHLQKGSCTWRLHDRSAMTLAYATIRFNEIFSDVNLGRIMDECRSSDDGLIASMIDLICEAVDIMRITIDYVMGRSTTETAMGSPLNRFEIIGLQRHVHGDDASVWEYQMCGHLLYCEGLIGKLGKLRSTLRHATLINAFFSESAMNEQRRNEVESNVATDDETQLQKTRDGFNFDVV